MIFTSAVFVLFLITVFILYWGRRASNYQNAILVAASYSFYAWWDIRFCLLLFLSSSVDYLVGRGIGKSDDSRQKKILLFLSVGINLGILGFFKYWNFFVDTYLRLADIAGFKADFYTVQIILPVGISFYTFQTLGYTIDVYRGKVTPCSRFINYLTYVAFFPQLVAGPIERAGNLLTQISRPRKFNYYFATEGLRQILWGFFKKMVIADNLGMIVESYYGNWASSSGPELSFATVCFSFQIYCDFSAYADIAVGVARLFGVRLMRNFSYPYFSQSVGEFWRRWHISLSSWFRDYVYIPLGGSRVSRFRRGVNLLVTFLISGLWHGASWHFVAWGGAHGIAVLPVIFYRKGKQRHASDIAGGEGLLPDPRTFMKMVATFCIVTIFWVFFRAETMAHAFQIFKKISLEIFDTEAYVTIFAKILHDGQTRSTIFFTLLMILFEWFNRKYEHPLKFLRSPLWLRWAFYTTIIWVTVYFGTSISGDFIYFQF